MDRDEWTKAFEKEWVKAFEEANAHYNEATRKITEGIRRGFGLRAMKRRWINWARASDCMRMLSNRAPWPQARR